MMMKCNKRKRVERLHFKRRRIDVRMRPNASPARTQPISLSDEVLFSMHFPRGLSQEPSVHIVIDDTMNQCAISRY